MSPSPPVPPPPPEAPPLLAGAPAGARVDTYTEMWADRVAVRHRSDGGGRWVLIAAPERLAVGDTGRFELRYEAGPEGVAEGGALTFVPEPFWGWSPPQARSPEAPGFVRWSAPEGLTLVPEPLEGQLVLRVTGRALAPGEVVTLVYGEGAGAQVDRFADAEAGLYLAVDGDGDGVRAWVRPAPTVPVGGGPAAGLVLTVPTTAAPGARVTLRVAAVDAAGNRAGAEGPVALRWPEGWEGPATVALSDGVGVARAAVTGPTLGTVEGRFGELSAVSNPLLVRDGAPRVLWADLQIHTGRSDGTGTPADAYRYAREVAGLDVAAITDHDRFGMRYLDADPALWREAIDAAAEATTDGFVAIPGYEWTNWVHGHRHVLYFGTPGPVYSSLDPATDTPPELWAALRGQQALTVAHHPAGGPVPVDWSFPPDPELEPVVEVASVHGQSESPTLPSPIYDVAGDGWVADQLQGGARLGLIGSTDGHDGHPGLAHLVGQGVGGLAALVDATPTRDGIYEALRARRVYATNGPRMLLRFEVDGQPMGSVLPPGSHEVVLRVVGTAPLLGVELVRRGGVERVTADGATTLHHRWPIDAAEGDLVYVRVVQADGGIGWTSPVWFAR